MDRAELEALWQRRKLQTLRLLDVENLTRELLQAARQRDQVTLNMLLSMREEPLRRLEELEAAVRQQLLRLPREDAVRAKALLEGAPASGEEEAALAAQVAQYRRTLDAVVELDRRLNLSLTGDKSFYKMFRN